VAVQRLKLANPHPLVALKHNPYQVAFMEAVAVRTCAAGHKWVHPYDGTTATMICPICKTGGQRGFKRFLLRAGRRGGKTRIGAVASIRETSVPLSTGWCCAPTYTELEDFVLPAFFKQIPQVWLDDPRTDWSESEYTLILPNRAITQFRSLEDPERGRGPGLGWLWIDEICKLTLKHWETIRPTLTEQRGILIGTTTPKGEDWVHEAFYVPAEEGRPGYWACHYTTLDNPIIDPEEVEEARSSMSELMFRQEYLADIVTFTGAIYGEYVPHCEIAGTDEEMKHYFPEWPNLDLSRPAITGLDPGTDHPFAGVHLVHSPRGLVVVGEYEERNRVYQLHSAEIQQMRRGFSGCRVGIDRSQAQAMLELAMYGLFTTEADNDVVAGINRVASWMIASKHKPGQLPAGLVLPRSCCPKLIKRLKSYRWAEQDKRDGSTHNRELVYKKHDDLPDALRYALMLYPERPKSDPIHTKSRDLSGMPDNTRLELERMRRIEELERKKTEEERQLDMGDSYPMVPGDEEAMLGMYPGF
jgi:hypothetical protein